MALDRGPALTHDFHTARAIPGIRQLRIGTIDRDGQNTVFVQAEDNARDATYSVFYQSDYSVDLVVSRHGQLHEIVGPWNDRGMGRFLWLSQIILSARNATSTEVANSNLAQSRFSKLWWEKSPKRLAQEILSVEQRFPKARLYKHQNRLLWALTVLVEGRSFDIQIIYDDMHPIRPPYAYCTSIKELPVTPHSPRGSGGYLCWTPRTNSPWNVTDTAVTAILGSIRFLLSVLIFQTTKKWPQGAEMPPAAQRGNRQ